MLDPGMPQSVLVWLAGWTAGTADRASAPVPSTTAHNTALRRNVQAKCRPLNN